MKKGFLQAFKESLGLLKQKNQTVFDLIYWNKNYILNIAEGKFIPDDLNEREKILILHYLNSLPAVKDERLITFKELPTGNIYFSSIYSRVYQPVIEKYGKYPEEFIVKCVKMGGKKIKENTIEFNIFPEVKYLFELIPEDEEFPAELKVFFNRTTLNIFKQIEDVVIIAEEITEKIVEE